MKHLRHLKDLTMHDVERGKHPPGIVCLESAGEWICQRGGAGAAGGAGRALVTIFRVPFAVELLISSCVTQIQDTGIFGSFQV